MNGPRQAVGALSMVMGLFIVLGVLAVLQYRWTGELSVSEKERMRRSVGDSARRLSEGLDDAIAEFIAQLRPDPLSALALEEQVAFAIEGLPPSSGRLLRETWIVRIEDPESTAAKLDHATMKWRASTPPDFIQRLDAWGPGGGRGLRLQPFLSDIPALVIPAGQPRSASGSPPGRGPGSGPSALIVAVLDRERVGSELLPQLVERYFGDDDSRTWTIEIRDREKGKIVYRSEPPANDSRPDFEMPMLGIRPGGMPTGPDTTGRPPRTQGEPGGPRGEHFGGPRTDQARPVQGPWLMRIWHRDGSLEAAVQRSRMRNLSMSAGVLVLLLVGGLMIIANAHRSRQLAKQQLDFVAAVTHELNTPIAAISSAGQNLSDGVVRGEEQVRRYGSMIEREGRRLASMVDQVLEFAGMQRASLPLSIRQVRLDELVDQAIASAAWMIEENEVTIERELPNHDAVVTCDRDELVRALTNLISNAIKYRGRCDRIAIAARLDSRVGEAVFSVSDEGLGVSGEDQTRIFEPFVRGSNIHDRAIRGSGLGLSIVRRIAHAHGGRVELKSRSGEGSVFSIHIPLR